VRALHPPADAAAPPPGHTQLDAEHFGSPPRAAAATSRDQQRFGGRGDR
jgi:hypothetical protein